METCITITTEGTSTSQTIISSEYAPLSLNRELYEEDLKRRQKEHLGNIQRQNDANWRPCLHESCPECLGTGIREDGCACVHLISCPCPRCAPSL